MKPGVDFMTVMADFDKHPEALLWRAGSPVSVKQRGEGVLVTIPFRAFSLQGNLLPVKGREVKNRTFYLSSPGRDILHFYNEHDRSPMLCQSDLKALPLEVVSEEDCWIIGDSHGRKRAEFRKYRSPEKGWSTQIMESFDSLQGALYPDGQVKIEFASFDQFFPGKVESLPLAFLEWAEGGETFTHSLFSFRSPAREHFSGTGERFAPMDLKGKTLVLENRDGLGVNSRRAYKNVPFFLSSRGYGLFIHTSSHVRLSLADVSTRAAQALMEEDRIDLFLIGGGAPEPVLHNYRRLTGFPPELPRWTYGTWMSRMTYFSADEITDICRRMHEESYPCDVIHIDTGWFARDWVCEWKFSEERFPDPEGFMKTLRNQGYRVSLWQTPNIGEGNCLLEEAREKRYLAPPRSAALTSSSDFSGQDFGGQIDFTNPGAVNWYKGLIRKLLKAGASVIKTDFGENIQFDADYMNMSSDRLHNLYGLLYQKAAFEETQSVRGEALVWARAGWAGCQRYPLHWGGDAEASWDGMAASLRGGLHLAMSGFGYWSHDVPGFHSSPEFMNSPLSDALYMRWTQFGVFSSHLRYHGTSAREPWHFPGIAAEIRQWLNLRYHLIPYFMQEAEKMTSTGYSILRPLSMMFPEDETTWFIDHQFFCGDSFLVCPVMNDEGSCSVYLPKGRWIDFWTGEGFNGPGWHDFSNLPLSRMPLFCPEGAVIPVYPERVLNTDEMAAEKTAYLSLDGSFRGWLTTEYAGDYGFEAP